MIPAKFDYERPSSLSEAISLLSSGGPDARPIAGGHSLLPLMRLRLSRPTLLVDIGGLSDLRYVREDGDHLAIGALATHDDLARSAELLDRCALIPCVAEQIGDPQVRHRGTIGGSVAHADPASDLPAALMVLDAEIIAHGSNGPRTVLATDFFQGPFMSALEPDEILTEIRVPARDGWGSSYQKFQRRAQDWAIVGVTALIESGDGITGAAIGLTNMGGTPLRATAVEQALLGSTDPDGVAAAAAKISEIGTPPADENASSEYRLHLAEVLIKRAVAEALS